MHSSPTTSTTSKTCLAQAQQGRQEFLPTQPRRIWPCCTKLTGQNRGSARPGRNERRQRDRRRPNRERSTPPPGLQSLFGSSRPFIAPRRKRAAKFFDHARVARENLH